MDKKNTLIGILCIAAGIGFMFWQASELEKQRREALREEARQVEEAAKSGGDAAAPAQPEAVADDAAPAGSPEENPEAGASEMVELLAEDITPESAADAVVSDDVGPEERVTLSNDFIEVEFTTRGGAIREVRFLQTKRGGEDDYVFNEDGFLPALSLSLAGRDGAMQEFALPYTVLSQTESSITFQLEAANGLTVERRYRLATDADEQDPYVIRHNTRFVNAGETPKALATIYLNLGTARPIAENQRFNYLNVGQFDGNDADFTAINKLTGSSGFLGIGANAPKDQITRTERIEWASVKNQFFASVLSSPTVGRELLIYPVEGAPAAQSSGNKPPEAGITGSVGYTVGRVAAGAEQALDFEFYVGPKEFKRLQALGNEQDLVMQFGFFGFFSKLLLAFMYAVHSVVPSWGWSIVIMTILIKLLFWPLTAKASRSQKRMSKIQEPMQALREKYKDNPQKMQQETLKLFKEHQVNPVAGCLPMLIQMPIFIGLFYMLRTASELRHAPFLWIGDLSQPDTIASIGGFPLNLLPLIMGATMFLQMQMMPTSPTADPVQQKIFKFLPAVFLVFLYNFSSGLVLYWTVQNVLTIVQQKITNSLPDEDLKAAGKVPDPVAAERAKPVAGKVVSGRAKGKKKKK